MSSDAKKYFVLQYNYSSDIMEKRGPYRTEHLQRITTAKDEGTMIMAGALVDPVDEALLIFSTTSKDDVVDFAENDPYYKAGLISSYTVREWSIV